MPAGCKSKYKAHSEFGAFKTIKELPPVEVTTVTLNKSSLKLNAGGSAILIATVNPSDATNKKLTWKSSNTSIADVDANGKVTVKASAANGASCDITATANNGKNAVCKITVDKSIKPVSSIALSASELTMYPGQKKKLTAKVLPNNATDKTVTWTSSKLSVATVNPKTGEITAVGYGEADITAYAGSKSIVCKLTVSYYTPLNGISLEESDLVLSEGEEKQLIVKFNPIIASNQSISWSINKAGKGVVMVDSKGKIKALKEGEAEVTATSEEGGYKATCKVKVGAKAKGVNLNIYAMTLNRKQTIKLVATVWPSNAVNKSVRWNSSNNQVATVENGTVTGVGGGDCEIIATSVDGGFVATCKIHVTGPALGISELGGSAFKLYPNPVISSFTIETGERGILHIYKLDGSLVRSIRINSDKQRICIKDLKSGVYVAKIGSKIVQFIKK